MNRKNIILFDLDGTITDSKQGIAKSVQYALSHYGIEEPDVRKLYKFIGPPLRVSFRDFYGFDAQKAEEVLTKYREYYKDKGIYENLLYDDIKRVISELYDAGKKLILATSKPRIFAVEIMRYFDLEKYFDFIGGSELNGQRDDKAEVIRYVLEQTGISDLSSVVMVGDRKYDVLGAKEAGIDCVGVLYGFGDLKELTEAGANCIVEKAGELLDILI